MTTQPPTVTFVTPRYGRGVMGGAETGARSLATHMAADGWDVRVLTTCALSAVTWADEYSPGITIVDGVQVQRHRVRRPRAGNFDALSKEILAEPSSVSTSDALDWIDAQGPDSPDLLEAVAAVDVGTLALYPYLYQPTVRGVRLARVPTVLHAAAHPELPFELPIFDQLLGGVSGHAFHSQAEQELVARRSRAAALLPQVVLGLPVDAPDPALVSPEAADSARSSIGVGDEPFALYLGRVDRGKGTDELARAAMRFAGLRSRGRFVLAGPVVHAPPAARGVDVLGQVSEELKWGLLAAADVLINPSPHESFSLVLLESWLAGTPVLVNATSAPMVEHCKTSGGGLWYHGVTDFDAALDLLLADSQVRQRLADAGGRYTRESATWPAVRSRYEALLSRVS